VSSRRGNSSSTEPQHVVHRLPRSAFIGITVPAMVAGLIPATETVRQRAPPDPDTARRPPMITCFVEVESDRRTPLIGVCPSCPPPRPGLTLVRPPCPPPPPPGRSRAAAARRRRPADRHAGPTPTARGPGPGGRAGRGFAPAPLGRPQCPARPAVKADLNTTRHTSASP